MILIEFYIYYYQLNNIVLDIVLAIILPICAVFLVIRYSYHPSCLGGLRQSNQLIPEG